MDRFRKISNDPIIYVLDYSDLKVTEMVELLHQARMILVAENQPCYLITIFNDRNFTTPVFMREPEKVTFEVSH